MLKFGRETGRWANEKGTRRKKGEVEGEEGKEGKGER
jgi:hypothetical protein